jgi:hypothetical protein
VLARILFESARRHPELEVYEDRDLEIMG